MTGHLLTLHSVGFLGLWGRHPETVTCQICLTAGSGIQAPTLESSRLKFTHMSLDNWPGEQQQIISCLFKAAVQGLPRFLLIEDMKGVDQSDEKEWLLLLPVAVSKPSALPHFWSVGMTAAQISQVSEYFNGKPVNNDCWKQMKCCEERELLGKEI